MTRMQKQHATADLLRWRVKASALVALSGSGLVLISSLPARHERGGQRTSGRDVSRLVAEVR